MSKTLITKQSSASAQKPLSQRDLLTSFLTGNWTEEVDTQTQFSPEVDISETKDAFHIKANVPGIDPEKIEVEVQGTKLALSGQTENEEKEEGENFYRIERSTGSFYRSFELPTSADMEKISCKAKHGVLKIDIPKKGESKGKRVKVSVEK